MKIEFCGAAQHVTGSKHLMHINGRKILLDCGMFQGHRKETEAANKYFPFEASEIDALVLSHAHIDHCGLIPLLVKNGFEGPIYCTHATRDLCSVMLRDSAHIQEKDAEYLKKRGKDKNATPLYTLQDAEKSLSYFRSVSYDQPFNVAPRVKCTFYDAGHILGSAMEHWDIYDEDTKQQIRFGFTGDLGRNDLPVLKDPGQLEELDVFLTESTYGNRFHDEIKDVEDQFAGKVNEAAEKGGKIIIPAFAMGRTQEILFILKDLIKDGKIKPMPIFVDSPLANQATGVFSIHPECFDKQLEDLINDGIDPFYEGNGVHFTQSVEESKSLRDFPGAAIIISASGMCEFGRIRHHLSNTIQDAKNTVLIVGYQAQNTLGRKLVDGETSVNIFGDPHVVRAEVVIYNAFSGHADQRELLEFAAKVGSPKSTFLVHGEIDSQEVFAEKLVELDNLKDSEVFIPRPGEIYELQVDKTWKRSAKQNMECEGIVCKI